MSHYDFVKVGKGRRKVGGPSGFMPTLKSAEIPPGHTLYSRNYELKFPYPDMYKAQANICDRLIHAMDLSKTQRSAAFLESPTGTGKTLALLTASLGWQEKIMETGGVEHLAAFKAEIDEDPSPTPPTQPSVPPTALKQSAAERASSISQIMLELSDWEEDNFQDIPSTQFTPSNAAPPTPSSDTNAAPQPQEPSPGGTFPDNPNRRKRGHVDIDLEDMIDFQPDLKRPPSATTSSDASSSNTGNTNESSPEGASNPPPAKSSHLHIPTIFYATRTHSQVQKAIAELYDMPYRPKMAALGARDNFCLDPEVKDLPKGTRENACRTKVRKKRCTFHANREAVISAPDVLAPSGPLQVWDLEDMTKLGKYHSACGYYAAREMAKSAQLVFCPYNYLIDLAIVQPFADVLRDSIVIIDEAHNIEDVCRTEASLKLSISTLDEIIFSIRNAFELPRQFPRMWAYRVHGLVQDHIAKQTASAIPTENVPETPEKPSGRPTYSLFSSASTFYVGSDSNQAAQPNAAKIAREKEREEEFAEKQRFFASFTPVGFTPAVSQTMAHTHWSVLEEAEGDAMPPQFPEFLFSLRKLLDMVSRMRDWLHTTARRDFEQKSANNKDGYGVWMDETVLQVFGEEFKITPFNIRAILQHWEELQHMISEMTEWMDEAETRHAADKKANLMNQLAQSSTYRGYLPSTAELIDEDIWGVEPWKKRVTENKLNYSSAPVWTILDGAHLSDLERLFRIYGFMLLNDLQYLEDFRVIIERPKTSVNVVNDENGAPRAQNHHNPRGSAGGYGRGRNWTPPPGYAIQYHFLCLNPACLFRELLSKARLVTLVSGTLSPFASMRAELGVESLVSPSAIVQFSTQHIIPPGSKQLMALRLNALTPTDLDASLRLRRIATPAMLLPRNQPLKWVYHAKKDAKAANALGMLLLGLLPAVPDGALAFFTSYDHIRFCVSCWQSGDGALWKALNHCKPIFIEPSASSGGTKVKEAFKEMHQSYLTTINAGVLDGTSRGALFLGVARGKIAEGIDFADQYARAVFIVGIPFPSIKEPAIEQKRRWNQDRFSEEKSLLINEALAHKERERTSARPPSQNFAHQGVRSLLDAGNRRTIPTQNQGPSHPSILDLPFKTISDWHSIDEMGASLFLNDAMWYDAQAFRAVNQTLGRCIRHASDYGAIIFLDDRFETDSVERHLSSWVRSALSPSTALITPIVSQLEAFYKNNLHLKKQVKPTNPAQTLASSSALPALSPFAAAASTLAPGLNKASSWSSHQTIIDEGIQRRSTDPFVIDRTPVNAFERLMPSRSSAQNQAKAQPSKAEKQSNPNGALQAPLVPENAPVSALKAHFQEISLSGPPLREPENYEKDASGVIVPILKSPFV